MKADIVNPPENAQEMRLNVVAFVTAFPCA